MKGAGRAVSMVTRTGKNEDGTTRGFLQVVFYLNQDNERNENCFGFVPWLRFLMSTHYHRFLLLVNCRITRIFLPEEKKGVRSSYCESVNGNIHLDHFTSYTICLVCSYLLDFTNPNKQHTHALSNSITDDIQEFLQMNFDDVKRVRGKYFCYESGVCVFCLCCGFVSFG